MSARIVEAADVYQVCDWCFKGTANEDWIVTDKRRKLMGGSSQMVPICLCRRCFEALSDLDETARVA